jgi:integrase
MATIRQRSSGSWEVIIRRKALLPKAHTCTFHNEGEAREYSKKLERLLDQGILPLELQDIEQPSADSVKDWAQKYLSELSIADSDRKLINALFNKMSNWPVSQINIEWALQWVADMKRNDRLTPTTIKHKVGAVARMLDWCKIKKWIEINPLRLLPTRYSKYAPIDGDEIVNIERERRLMPGEYEKIIFVLKGGFPATKQRGISEENLDAWNLLFILAHETGMRLREMYTISNDQVDISKATIFLDKTKNGDKRQVPLSSIAINALVEWKSDGMLFPWWDGQMSSLEKTTAALSQKWSRISKLAGCDDFHFHDLRHTAVCNFYEKTTLTDLQIAKITGHKDLRMLKRYANLRGSELAGHLW